jgi:hypothetical protein
VLKSAPRTFGEPLAPSANRAPFGKPRPFGEPRHGLAYGQQALPHAPTGPAPHTNRPGPAHLSKRTGSP